MRPKTYTPGIDGLITGAIADLLGKAPGRRQARILICARSKAAAAELATACGITGVNVRTSIETQEWADKRIPLLESIPSPVRFLSAEPLLGPVDLRPALQRGNIGWVIAGGESGSSKKKIRPMLPHWPRDIRDACHDAGVPFFFKQWGSWAPLGMPTKPGGEIHFSPDDEPVQWAGAGGAEDLLDGTIHRVWPAVARRDEVMV